MGANFGKRTVVECNGLNLIVTILAIILAVVATFLLTYFLTKNAYDTSKKPGGDDNNDNKEEDNSPSAAELRLPTSVEPVHYDLKVKVYLPNYVNFPQEKDFTFDGDVEMTLKIIEPVKKIVLNMRDIKIDKEHSVFTAGGEKIDIEKVEPLPKLEKVDIVLAKPIEKGKDAKLKLIYTGIINNKLGGLYQTTYHEKDGTKKVAAVTQLEPTDARGFLPCFDEPHLKATWNVTVIHPKGTNAISNGIELEGGRTEDGDWITTKFTQTPRMSSYLLAVMVNEFEYIQGKTKSGVLFRIWSRPDAKSMTQYALYAGIKCLEFYEKLFDFKFPLEKQDMVALPDFSAGAMENWGMITYRENSLLYDERLYGPMNKQRVALVVAHELGHQWFGDLVTMKWWDDLWLNEGFATWVEFFGIDVISDGHWRMPEYIILDALTQGLTRDSVARSHPLSFRIDKATEVFEAFDSISYGKGASILRMLSAIIGADTFHKGIAHYVSKFAYKNAQAADLWQAIDEVVENVEGPNGKMKVLEYADQWTAQMGFPIVTVSSFNDTHVKITQERYKKNPKAKDPEKYSRPKYGFKWEVPIWYQEGKEKVQLAWLKREEPLYLKSKPDEPIAINAERNGFYRQNYDAKGWEKLSKQLHQNHEIYSTKTRNAIISDAYAAALVDKVPYETVFELLSYVKKEQEFLPWQEALNGFFNVLEFFGNEPEAKSAKKFMLRLLEPIYKKSSLKHIEDNYKKEELFFEMNLEQAVIDAYCSLGSPECIANYKNLFDSQVLVKCHHKGAKPSECSSVAAPLRAKTYCYGVKEGGDAVYKKMMDLYLAESVQLEKDILRRALGCHKDISALKELMLLALDRNASFVRLQDVNDIFYSVAANPVGQEIIFNFLVERWEQIYDGLMPEHRAVGKVIESAAIGIRSQHQIEQVRYLKKNGKHASDFGDFDEIIEKSEHKVDWIKKHFRRLSDFFKKSVGE
ncbi:hypothetical protein Y032_0312g2162 [Ancylostoma ceylanicum]|uniref:Aminopeptidase n=1 Tax=Ancylostoma ceylanicum TaxID=53326 RepID=A0A016S203_9BILA|nr:hypothetical protein Y032_0312g2162 [Ancylostoma ceylanicum]